MQITLYRNNAHFKRVDKSGYLSLIGGTFGAEPLEPMSIVKPSLIISTGEVPSIADCNYCHIPTLKRWYFVDDIILLSGGRVQINARVDVLMSNQTQIRNLRCTVKRQEYNYNMDLPDNDIPVLNGRQLTYRSFSATPFSANPTGGPSYTLTVGGVVDNQEGGTTQ